MSYMHINNLYKDQRLLLFRECYALEKVHGTSAHLSWNQGTLTFSSGGAKHETFKALFDAESLAAKFTALGHLQVTVYGEAYGGSMQKMSATYGKELRFIAFEVQVGEHFLSVPDAAEVVAGLGLEFVPYARIPVDLAGLDALRDAPSEVAVRRGITTPMPREGLVLRPLLELRGNNDERVICKHKGDAFKETETSRITGADPAKLVKLSAGEAIAKEWVTEQRLTHVLDKLPPTLSMTDARQLITAMVEDVEREATGEIIASQEARSAIGKRTMTLFKARLAERLKGATGE